MRQATNPVHAGPAAGIPFGYRLLGNVMLALALVGYPLAAALSQVGDFSGGELNIGYRGLVVAMSVLLALWSMSRGRYRIDPLIGVFFAAYSLRMIVDYSYSMLPHIEEDFFFYLAVVLLPTLALGGVRDWFDEKTLLKATLLVGGIAGVLVAYLLITGASTTNSNPNAVSRAALEFLNPISIGYHGLFISVAAVVLLAKHRTQAIVAPSIIALIAGSYLLVASGSRGPFVALLIGLVVTGAANRHANATYVLAAAIIAGAVAYLGLPEGIINRFRDIDSDLSALERLYAMQLSIEGALANLIVGYAYIEPVTGFYPHNLLIEAAMAIGIGGFLLMLAMQISLLVNAWRLASNGEWTLPFLAAAMFANAWISGSIWGSALFFMLLWVIRERRNTAPTPHPIPARLG
jgi:hypothetical protein